MMFIIIKKVKMEHSQEFYPENFSDQSEQRYGPPKKQQKYVAGPNNGVWNDLQHTKYIVFMEHNKQKMRSKQKRRTSKLYKAMSEYIGTRNALQCRSHHQKLEEKYLYPNKIIANFKQHHQLQLYNNLKLQLEEQTKSSQSRPTSVLKLQQHSPQQNPTEQQVGVQVNPSEITGAAGQCETPSVKAEQLTSSFQMFHPYQQFPWPSCPVSNYTPFYLFPSFSLY